MQSSFSLILDNNFKKERNTKETHPKESLEHQQPKDILNL